MSIEGELNLRDESLLQGIEDFIRREFSPADQTVYRWCGQPAEDKHFEVLSPRVMSDTWDAKEEETLAHELGLSVYDTVEHSKKEYKIAYNKRKSDTAKKSFRKRKGDKIVKLELKAEDGYLGMMDKERGHMEFLPSKTFKYDERISEYIDIEGLDDDDE